MALAAVVLALPGRAARPLLDNHQWDAYFGLFAQDVSVPWKPATIRLDTYSGAPIEFAAYAVDPAEVVVAGANHSARAIDTSKLKAVVRWRFSPPPGYRFATSDVTVPLGSSEGFYVIEARRGDATQQVWLDRTHVGLVAKTSPDGLAVWGVDLRSGQPLRGMHVEFLTAGTLVERVTDGDGLIVWRDPRRPTFALASDGASRSFVSLLPQAPLPAALVEVRTAESVVRAGERVTFAGFVRRRSGGTYRRAGGDVRLALSGRGNTLASTTARLDEAGAFSGDLTIPGGAAAGDYSLLASAVGAVGGTELHVDAATDLTLAVVPNCPCTDERVIDVAISASRAGTPVAGSSVSVEIVRAPHVIPPDENVANERWGTTRVLQRTVVTGADGRAEVRLRRPSDGLASTYAVRASTAGNGATASARFSVPTAPVALAVEPDALAVDVGRPIGVEIRGFRAAGGAPAGGLSVDVRMTHGATAASQTVRLGEGGRAHVVFDHPSLGSNLIQASASDANLPVLDAASVLVAPRALQGRVDVAPPDVSVSLDRGRYRLRDRIGVHAAMPGAQGSALVTLEGARTYATRVVPAKNGAVATDLALSDVQGDVRIGVALVRDGAVDLGEARVHVDAPGHERALDLVPDHQSYAGGSAASVALGDGNTVGGATLIERLSDGTPSGGASFDDVPAALGTGATTSQNPAAPNPAWHTWVAPAHSKASDIFAAESPRTGRRPLATLGAAAPRTLLWRVERRHGSALDVTLPSRAGTYVFSIVAVYDDGDVGAATTTLQVK